MATVAATSETSCTVSMQASSHAGRRPGSVSDERRRTGASCDVDCVRSVSSSCSTPRSTPFVEEVGEQVPVHEEDGPQLVETPVTVVLGVQHVVRPSVVTDQLRVVDRDEVGLRVEVLLDGVAAITQHLLEQPLAAGARLVRRVDEPSLDHQPLLRVLLGRVRREGSQLELAMALQPTAKVAFGLPSTVGIDDRPVVLAAELVLQACAALP